MAHESFEDPEVARILNAHFISIKVDREERPDVDAVYMEACQALTGSGGWPLTVLMAPDQKPFWVGTYLPKTDRYGQTGLMSLLKHVRRLWSSDRERVLQTGDEITDYLNQSEEPGAGVVQKELVHDAARTFRRSFDSDCGGFGGAPKFPSPHNLIFLMQYARREQDDGALRMVEKTLVQMARGGLFDQIGGGFSRYSTDDRWLVPHFEKMLYDNALLTCAYLEAFDFTGRDFYRTVARRTLDYVLKELTGPQGEFYCGQDADSEGKEGKYYLFSSREVRETLGTENGEAFCNWYDITEQGNFEEENIPNLLRNAMFENEPPELAAMRRKLYAYRQQRTALHRDDKVLTAWNALMIAALAKAYRYLGDERYLEAALRADRFIRDKLTSPDGRLWLRWREGEAANDGQLDDYAFLAWAQLELYASDFHFSRLERAVSLMKQLQERFLDRSRGGFFLTADDAQALIVRPKETYDGALPSGNSVAGLVLSRLEKLTGQPEWRDLAKRQLEYLAGAAREYPAGHTFALLALCDALYPSRELVCATSEEDLPQGLMDAARQFGLNAVLKTRKNAADLSAVAPFTASYPLPEQGSRFYLCSDGACLSPVDGVDGLYDLLRRQDRS